jgi:hypothetical protein
MGQSDSQDAGQVSSSQVLSTDNRDAMPSLLRDVLEYWETLCDGAFAPNWKQFNLYELPPKIIPWCIVVDVIGDGINNATFRYRFWGTERTQLVGFDLTGKTVEDMPRPDMIKALLEDYREVCKSKIPLLLKKSVTFQTDDTVDFLSIRLPLSDDGQRVTHVLAVSYYPTITGAHYAYYDVDPPVSVSRKRLDP